MFSCSFATLDQAFGDERLSLKKIQADIEKNKKLEDERIRQEKIELDNKNNEIKKKNRRILRRFMRKNKGVWKHPQFNCYIPVEIKSVPSKDGVNKCSLRINKDGTYNIWESLVGRIGGEDWTEDEYLQEYCRLGEGKYSNNYYFTGHYMPCDLRSIYKYICDDHDSSEDSDFESESDNDNDNDNDNDSDEELNEPKYKGDYSVNSDESDGDTNIEDEYVKMDVIIS